MLILIYLFYELSFFYSIKPSRKNILNTIIEQSNKKQSI
jgi:hypothetical protein